MLILASASPRRKHLLESLGIPFEVCPAGVEELDDHLDPRELVETNARLKTGHVAESRPEDWVLGADTTVALGAEILNKPAGLDEARAMLRRMSGRTHRVYTAVCLMNRQAEVDHLFCVTSDVTFKPFDDDCITRYFALVNPLDKAGAYGIQEGRELIIEGWEGSFSNIMGLPMDDVGRLLQKHGL